MATPPISLDEFTTSRAGRLHSALAKIDGFDLTGPAKGQLFAGRHVADLRLVPGDALRLMLEVGHEIDPPAALRAGRQLPANLRFAVGRGGLVLLGDTQLDGEAHLAQSFRNFQAGIARALGETGPQPTEEPLDSAPVEAPVDAAVDAPVDAAVDVAVDVAVDAAVKAAVETAMDKSNWDEDSVVQHDGGWEVRPRLRSDVVPVRLALDGAEVRLHRKVIADMPAGDAGEAVAAEALRINAQLRHARLAIDDGVLVAEARLHAGQISPSWLGLTARAIAVACRRAQSPLRVLATQPDVAAAYLKIFGCRHAHA